MRNGSLSIQIVALRSDEMHSASASDLIHSCNYQKDRISVVWSTHFQRGSDREDCVSRLCTLFVDDCDCREIKLENIGRLQYSVAAYVGAGTAAVSSLLPRQLQH